MAKGTKKSMKLIKIPTKRQGRKLKLNVRKLRNILLVLILVAVVVGGLYLAWPWLKSKGIVPVGDNERKDALHASRDEQAYSEILLKNIEANEKDLANATPTEQYEYYADKANELTMLERYDEADGAFKEAEKRAVNDPKLAEALYTNWGMMYEAKGDKTAAHTMYQKALAAVSKLETDQTAKQIKTEEINKLLERTKG